MLQDERLLDGEITDTFITGHGPAVVFQVLAHFAVHIRIAAQHHSILLPIDSRQIESLGQFAGAEQIGSPLGILEHFTGDSG